MKKRIVAAIDFSEVTDKVVETAADLARGLHGEVVLFHVDVLPEPWVDASSPVDGHVAGMPTVPLEWHEERRAVSEQRLHTIQRRLRSEGISARVETGAVRRERIVDEIEALDPDMIVVGSHRHGALHNLVFRGVCMRAVRNAPCTVVVVHRGDGVPTPEPEYVATAPVTIHV